MIPSICDYSDAYTLEKRTLKIVGTKSDAAIRNEDEINKQVTFKNFVPFTDYIRKMNNNQIDNTTDFDILMLMYNIMEYSNSYAKHQNVCGSITKITQMVTLQILSYSDKSNWKNPCCL